MTIDLQFHSIYSDGYLAPTQLARFVAGQGVKIASLTDHNTVAGQAEFKKASAKYKIKTIPGLELYVKAGNRRINILWYNYDQNAPELHKILLETQNRRRRNVRTKLLQLQKLGFHLDIETILSKFPDYVPLNRLTDELFASKYNQRKIKRDLGLKNPREEDLLSEYFFNKESGALRDACVNLERVLRLKKKVGGQIIFCHPGHYNKMRGNIIPRLKKMGVDGLELLSPHHSHETIMYIQYLADQFDFVTTGGSDFHKFELPGKKIRYSEQWFKIDSKYLRKIAKVIGK